MKRQQDDTAAEKRQRTETPDQMLRRVRDAFIAEPAISLDCLSIETIRRAEYMLRTYGLVFIDDASKNPELVERLIVETTNSYMGRWYPQLCVQSVKELAVKISEPNTATGLVGGKGNGALNMFPPRTLVPHVELDGKPEPVDVNPWHLMNVQMLARPEFANLAAFLIALGTTPEGNNTRKLSEDTCKVATIKNVNTPMHIDYYNNAKERLQGCLHVRVSDRDLGYLPCSPEVDEWMHETMPDIYTRYGFNELPKGEHADLVHKYSVAPKQGTLALWLTGTVHGEHRFTASNSVRTTNDTRSSVQGHVTRLYLGTHCDTLPVETLHKMTEMLHSDLPLAISRFHRVNPPSRVQSNKMATYPLTRYVQCARSSEELERVFHAAREFECKGRMISPLSLQLGGIPQSLDKLPLVASLLTEKQRAGWNEQARHSNALVKSKIVGVIEYPKRQWVRDGFFASNLIHEARMNAQ